MGLINKIKSLFKHRKEDYSWVEEEPIYKEVEGKLKDLEAKKAEDLIIAQKVYDTIGVKNYLYLVELDKILCHEIIEFLEDFEIHKKDFSLIAILALMIVEKGGSIPDRFLSVSPFIRGPISLKIDKDDVRYVIAPTVYSHIILSKDLKLVGYIPTGDRITDIQKGLTLFSYRDSIKTLCENFISFKNDFFKWLKERDDTKRN